MKERSERKALNIQRRQPLNAATEVATELRKAIISGALPAGARLIETDIAEQMAVSRGPVREALRILHEDQLIEMRPNKGAIVSAVTADDVLEVYAIRGCIGLIAIRNLMGLYDFSKSGKAQVRASINEIRNDDFAKLQALSGASSSEIVEQEFRIQNAIVRAASLPRVYRRFEQLTAEIHSLVNRLKIEYNTIDIAIDKYNRLLTAIHSGQRLKAEEIWRGHIKNSSAEILENIDNGTEALQMRPWMLMLY